LEVSVSLIFFFFQAEDGIRDYKVTGVQTCALPISVDDAGGGAGGVVGESGQAVLERDLAAAVALGRHRGAQRGDPQETAERAARSEERRVGKESRSRRASVADQTGNRIPCTTTTIL